MIDDVSFHIDPGEAYGLVGESGCGKSTIAMAVMRYLARNAVVEGGRIMLRGEDVLKLGERTLQSWRGKRMAMVYQDPGSSLNPSMRVGRQIAEIYRHHRGMGWAEALEAAATMLEKVRITDPNRVLRRYPHELSGGQQQRVVIAMALAGDPDLLVLDEPTTGLDATVEAEVLDLVEQLRDEVRSSILFISHNLGIVARICERVGVLYAGRLIEEGAARDVFREPRHPYTLALLRCVPRLGMRKGIGRLDPIPGSLPPLGTIVQGCIYADRCPIARERCREEPPPLYSVGGAHRAACHYHEEVPQIPPSPAAEPAPAATNGDGDGELLDVEELVKTYGTGAHQVSAVAGVTFGVKRGEIFGLVGESGSGKTSLAKCIVGLEPTTDGKLGVQGVELTPRERKRNRELRRTIQMVFQNPDTALNPRHTIRRILARSLKLLADLRSRRTQEERLRALAASVRLEPRHLDVRPAALSGGLKQRVSIARSFAGSPALVLCDEPVSALDVSVQAAILNLLVDLQLEERVSYVFISHDLAVVRYLSDRIGVMYLGELVEVGPAECVFEPPQHPYTEALVSAIPTLELDAPRPRIKLEGPLPSPADPPSGCRFHTRCPRRLGDICAQESPPWRIATEGHLIKCHRTPEELEELQLADLRAVARQGGNGSPPVGARRVD